MLASRACQFLSGVNRLIAYSARSSHKSSSKFYSFSYALSSARHAPCSINIKREYKTFDTNNVTTRSKFKPAQYFADDLSPNRKILQETTLASLASTIVNKSSPSIQPYMKLMRIDRPIGNSILIN